MILIAILYLKYFYKELKFILYFIPSLKNKKINKLIIFKIINFIFLLLLLSKKFILCHLYFNVNFLNNSLLINKSS